MKKPKNTKRIEHSLGFEIELLLPEGLPSKKVHMTQTRNTRTTSEIIEERIRSYWEKNRKDRMFDGDRARYEGFHYNEKTRELEIFYSYEKYRTYFFTGNSTLPKSYQAQLFSINGIVITKDNTMPIGLRRAEATNQGRIWHVIPAGYTDVKPAADTTAGMEAPIPSKRWYCESPHVAAARELYEELAIREEAFSASKMRLVGIVYNYGRNYDTTASIIIPVECDSSKLRLRGDEHERMRFVRATLHDLKQELIQLSLDPSTSSGHLRGDIALTIAHLYGYSKYIKTLESVFVETSGEE